MPRKYEVYIDGKPLLIAEEPDPRAVSQQVLVLHVDDVTGIARAVDQFRKRDELHELVLFGADIDRLWADFRSIYRFVQAAGGCVTDERSRLLAIHRLGVWDLPKGKVDEGEAIDAAALREVREECGLSDVVLSDHLCQTWHTYERKGRQHLKCTDWYLMRALSSEKLIAQTDEDISEVRWMNAAAIVEMKSCTYPSLLAVISAWERAVHRPA